MPARDHDDSAQSDPTPAALWPLFSLQVTTPRLRLRYIDDDLAAELAQLATQGIHDPDFMPFAMPWTDVAPPQQQRNTMQFYWRTRAETTVDNFHVTMAVLAEDRPIGSTSLMGSSFAVTRSFETGSWIGRRFQGHGYGKELREATLHLGFEGLGAVWATTSAFDDNGPSLGVTRSLGYEPDGIDIKVRRDRPATALRFRLHREQWASRLRRDDITLQGLEAARPLLVSSLPDA